MRPEMASPQASMRHILQTAIVGAPETLGIDLASQLNSDFGS